MKATKLYMAVSFLVALFLFPGCGKELEDMVIPETGSGVESPDNQELMGEEELRIRVSDAGYCDATTGSRATDNGVETTFTDGDQIGVFVVNSQNKVLYANVPYTKNGSDWTSTQGVRTKGYPVRVFAYYPYVEDAEIVGEVDSTANDASAFFQSYIDKLNVTDQSTPELYRKADVMTCMVTIADTKDARDPIALDMKHQMGLVIVNLPEKVTLNSVECYLKDREDITWTLDNVTLPANLSEVVLTVTGSRSIKPLQEATGFRYLCRSTDNMTLDGRFKTYGATKAYNINSISVDKGFCKIYNVSVNPFDATEKSEYIPQIGDYYMKDGRVLSSISSGDIDNCSGVVFWAGDPTIYDPILAKDYPKCTHGLIVSRFQDNGESWHSTTNPSSIQSWALGQSFYIDGSYLPLDDIENIQGYNNTQILKKALETFTDLNIAKNYYLNTPGLGGTPPSSYASSWYIPSPKEATELQKTSVKLDDSLSFLQSRYSMTSYLTSGEHSASNCYQYNNAPRYSSAIGVSNTKKRQQGAIRFVSAF